MQVSVSSLRPKNSPSEIIWYKCQMTVSVYLSYISDVCSEFYNEIKSVVLSVSFHIFKFEGKF